MNQEKNSPTVIIIGHLGVSTLIESVNAFLNTINATNNLIYIDENNLDLNEPISKNLESIAEKLNNLSVSKMEEYKLVLCRQDSESLLPDKHTLPVSYAPHLFTFVSVYSQKYLKDLCEKLDLEFKSFTKDKNFSNIALIYNKKNLKTGTVVPKIPQEESENEDPEKVDLPPDNQELKQNTPKIPKPKKRIKN